MDRQPTAARSKPDPLRLLLGERRLRRVLGAHGIAVARTLEQKISDAGPGNMRVDPHILTLARRNLEVQGEILSRAGIEGVPWYYLAEAPEDIVEARFAEQQVVYRCLADSALKLRVGQALEIAIYRALCGQALDYLGRFDLSNANQAGLFSKEEPPSYMGNRGDDGTDRRVDFHFHHPEVGWAAIEAKNVREWLYPDRTEIRDLLSKSVALDFVPVLIARRFPYVTFKVLSTCGVIVHQTYNQLFHEMDGAVAGLAKERKLLGYHDIHVGNIPDSRLTKFIGTNLPRVLPAARKRFDEFKDLLAAFASGEMPYEEFAARSRRRADGEDEDADWEQEEIDDWEMI